MYLDAIERLVELTEEMSTSFYPEITEYLRVIAEGSGGGGGSETGGVGVSIESMINGINGVNIDKANSISNIFNVLKDTKVTDAMADSGDKLAKTIDGIASAINKVDVDKDKMEAVGVLANGAGALISVARALTLSAPFLVAGALVSFALIPIAWSISKAFSMFTPQTIENMDKGGDALRGIGWSLMVFSAGIAISVALIGMSVLNNPVGVMALFGVMALSAVTFGLVGAYREKIVAGAWSVLGMSLSLLLFSYSIKTASDMMAGISMQSMMGLGLTLGGFAFIFGLAGKFWTEIVLGSVAFATIGLALMLISSPLNTIAKTVEKSPQMIWQIPLLMMGLGTAFALAGIPAVAVMIVTGALAFGTVGLSLMAIGAGIRSFGDISKFDPDGFKNAIVGIVGGFRAVSFKDIFLIPLKLPALLSMAFALGAIGYGIRAYHNNARDWTDEDSTRFNYTIESFTKAFSLKGVDYKAVEDGVDATWYMGKNLERLAKGIQAWEDIDFDIEKVKHNVSRILSTIPSIFAKVGKMNKGGTEFFGFTMTRGDVEDGIEATMGIGKNLINLADGIKAWEEIKFDVNLVKNNITKILTTIPSVFARIGRMKGGKVVRDFWGNDMAKEDIEAGVRATKDMGYTLVSLSKGVKAWENIKFDIGKVKTNVSTVLLAIPSIFAKIGRDAKNSEGIFSDSDHEEGANLVAKFVNPIQAVAKLVESLNKKNLDPKNVSRMIGSVFRALGKADQYIDKKTLKVLYGVSSVMDKMGRAFPKFNKGFREFTGILTKLSDTSAKNFFSVANSMEKISKAQIAVVKATGSPSSGNATNIVRQVTNNQTTVLTPEEAKEERKRQEKEKKLSVNEILVMKFDAMIDILTEMADTNKLSSDDLEEIRNAMVRTGIKVAKP